MNRISSERLFLWNSIASQLTGSLDTWVGFSGPGNPEVMCRILGVLLCLFRDQSLQVPSVSYRGLGSKVKNQICGLPWRSCD